MTSEPPWPPPMHMVTSPYRLPERRISKTSVVVRREPVAPIGWPRAIAPPLTLTMLRSSSMIFSQARYWAANASLNSTSWMSSSVMPARASALGVATVGPRPMVRGSQPENAYERMTASGLAELARFGVARHDQRRARIVDGARIARRDRAAFLENGGIERKLLHRESGLRALVFGHRLGFAVLLG